MEMLVGVIWRNIWVIRRMCACVQCAVVREGCLLDGLSQSGRKLGSRPLLTTQTLPYYRLFAEEEN